MFSVAGGARRYFPGDIHKVFFPANAIF